MTTRKNIRHQALADAPPLPADIGDQELLERLSAKEISKRQVLTILYERYHSELKRMIGSRVPSAELAEDIDSQVWLIVCEKLPEFEWRGTPIKHWLFAIAKRKRLEVLRRARIKQSLEMSLDLLSIPQSYLAGSIADIESVGPGAKPDLNLQQQADVLLAKALRALKPIDRKIINLIYYKNLNSTEIAGILNLTPANVRQRHKRALENIRR